MKIREVQIPTPISFRWSPEFVDRLDAARGDVPRSTFVRNAVEAALGVNPVESRLADIERRLTRLERAR